LAERKPVCPQFRKLWDALNLEGGSSVPEADLRSIDAASDLLGAYELSAEVRGLDGELAESAWIGKDIAGITKAGHVGCRRQGNH
jgi:hypothetical protein